MPSANDRENRLTFSEIGLAGLSRGTVFTSSTNSDILPQNEPRVSEEKETGFDIPISGVPTPHPLLVARSHDHKLVYQVGGKGGRGGEGGNNHGMSRANNEGGIETNVEMKGNMDGANLIGHDEDLHKNHPR